MAEVPGKKQTEAELRRQKIRDPRGKYADVPKSAPGAGARLLVGDHEFDLVEREMTQLMDAENAHNGAYDPPVTERSYEDPPQAGDDGFVPLAGTDEDLEFGEITAEVAHRANRLPCVAALAAWDTEIASGEPNPERIGAALDQAIIAGLALRSTMLNGSPVESTHEAAADLASKLDAVTASKGADARRPIRERAEEYVESLRSAVEEADRATFTYHGLTYHQWRASARRSRKEAHDSFERSDTDGYLSQWASQTVAREYDLKAELAANDSHWEFDALLDMDGRPVPAKHIESKYGWSWALMDENQKFTGEFINESKARKADARNKHYASKGYKLGRVRAPGAVGSGGNGINVNYYVFRTDGGYDPNAEVTETEQSHDY